MAASGHGADHGNHSHGSEGEECALRHHGLLRLLVMYGNTEDAARDGGHYRGRDKEVPNESKEGVLQHGSPELVSGGDKIPGFRRQHSMRRQNRGCDPGYLKNDSRPADAGTHYRAKKPGGAELTDCGMLSPPDRVTNGPPATT